MNFTKISFIGMLIFYSAANAYPGQWCRADTDCYIVIPGSFEFCNDNKICELVEDKRMHSGARDCEIARGSEECSNHLPIDHTGVCPSFQ
jgi:hypothetical protein